MLITAVTGTGVPRLDAQGDFRRARRRCGLARVARGLLGRQRGTLRTLSDDPVAGFDPSFRPAAEIARSRWERVALAHRVGTALPPIEVVERSDGFYVIDGCHRVSVARAMHRRDLDAWIRPAREI